MVGFSGYFDALVSWWAHCVYAGYWTAFVGLFAIDFLFVRWSQAVHRQHVFGSGAYSALIVMIQGYVVIGYVADHWTILAAGAGGFLGAALATWWCPNDPNQNPSA
jgi:hypothetical protein